MDIYDLETAFGALDVTTEAMRKAVADWFSVYYDQAETEDADPCQRVACTVVSKLLKSVFGEYSAGATTDLGKLTLRELERIKEEAMQMTLVGGECYLRPVLQDRQLWFVTVPRDRILIFGRDHRGEPTDIGCAARSRRGDRYFTLLERRTLDSRGYLTVKNQLYMSRRGDQLGQPVALNTLKNYENLAASYTYSQPIGSVGLVRLKNPVLNCVDGSVDGVSIYAPAMGLIRAVEENEAQLRGEFRRGQSRIVVSRDMLDRDKKLTGSLFVGLDEDPERVGITIFSPQLRESAYHARKQEYFRNIESVVGLKRGMLSNVSESHRTATEIAASAADFNLTVLSLQRLWEEGLRQAFALVQQLTDLYGWGGEAGDFAIDWGNGVLHDEESQWEAYRQMVADGLLKPEVALGWRFNMPIDTPQQLAQIRQKYMPEVTNG